MRVPSFIWVGAPVMGAHIPVDKGEWVVLLDNGCVVPSFVFFV